MNPDLIITVPVTDSGNAPHNLIAVLAKLNREPWKARFWQGLPLQVLEPNNFSDIIHADAADLAMKQLTHPHVNHARQK